MEGVRGQRMKSTQPILLEEEDGERRGDKNGGVREQNIVSIEEEDVF